MLGFDFGTIKHMCILPWTDVLDRAIYYYYPRVMERHKLSHHGIDIPFNEEVLYI